MSNANKPLKQNIAVIKSAVVKPEPPDYAEFDRFAEIGDKLAEAQRKIDRVVDDLQADDTPDDLAWAIEKAEGYLAERPRVEKLLAQFKVAETFYDRDAVYEQRYVDDDHPQMIAESFVSDQLTLLVGAFPNSVPHSPKVFTKMLFEEVKAYNPNAIILEAACRVLRRGKTFVPTVAEMLKALKEEGSLWCDRWAATGSGDECNVLDALAELAEILPDAKAKHTAETAEIEAACKAGRDARAKDMRRQPPDYHGDRRTKALCDAWHRGFDDEGRSQ